MLGKNYQHMPELYDADNTTQFSFHLRHFSRLGYKPYFCPILPLKRQPPLFHPFHDRTGSLFSDPENSRTILTITY